MVSLNVSVPYARQNFNQFVDRIVIRIQTNVNYVMRHAYIDEQFEYSTMVLAMDARIRNVIFIRLANIMESAKRNVSVQMIALQR